MRILAIDYGRKRLGLAKSDQENVLASPLPPFTRCRTLRDDVRALQTLAHEHGISRIVVGIPLNMDGTAGEMAQEARAFGTRLAASLQLPVDWADERRTTAEANRAMIEGNLSRKRRKKHIDSLAAVLILQRYLDEVSRQNLRCDAS